MNALAREHHVSPGRVIDIVNVERGINADSALRLGRYFGTGPIFLLNLQARYDLGSAEDHAGPLIERDVRPQALVTQE